MSWGAASVQVSRLTKRLFVVAATRASDAIKHWAHPGQGARVLSSSSHRVGCISSCLRFRPAIGGAQQLEDTTTALAATRREQTGVR